MHDQREGCRTRLGTFENQTALGWGCLSGRNGSGLDATVRIAVFSFWVTLLRIPIPM